MRAALFTLFFVFCWAPVVCLGGAISVNPDGTGDFTAIQAAIIDANDGDTIMVANGSYTGADNRDIVFLGKAITLRSENGAQSCFIDCEGLGRGFLIHNGEGPDTVIDGFTIVNGSADDGGGILCDGASVTILNCIIIQNMADNGGGVSIKDSAGATLKNCVIAENISNGAGAAGIDCVNADATIVNCTITDNSSLGDAGGISLIAESNALITNSILWADSPNEVSIESGSSASVTYSNVQGAWPGEGNINADPCFTGSPYGAMTPGIVSHWRFDESEGSTAYDSAGDNHGTIHGAQWAGGVIGGALRFDGYGDGVYIDGSAGRDSNLNIYNSDLTISAWIKSEDTGGTIVARAEPYRITYRLGISGEKAYIDTYKNSRQHQTIYTDEIVVQNAWHHIVGVFDRATHRGRIYVDGTERADEALEIDPYQTSAPTKIGCRNDLTDSLFRGLIDDVRIYDRAMLIQEAEQLYQKDYYLQADSPCTDRGVPNYVAIPDETDIDGNPRVVGEVIDMGAYEAHAMLAVSCSQFEFIANEGRPDPPDQPVAILNTGTRTLNWQIEYDCNWLSVDPNGGNSASEPNEVTLSVDTSGLTRGVYDCNLIISDPAAQNSPQIVHVEIIVHAPIIELSETSFGFFSPPDAPDPEPQILSIRNAGGGILNWRIDYDCNWLTVEPNMGASISEPSEVVLRVDTSGMALGNYNCNLVVSDPNAENSPQTIPVNLEISAECFPSDSPDYEEYLNWVAVGKPECWCYARQCRGDADGKKQGHPFLGYMYVGTDDLAVLISGWKVLEPPHGPGLLGNQACADFDHDSQSSFFGLMPIGTDDLAILITHWKVLEAPHGPGVEPDCGGTLEP